MTTSYAIPPSVPIHLHDVDHSYPHSRNHITQRPPSESAPTKGINGGPIIQEDNKIRGFSQSHSHFHDPPTQVATHQQNLDNEHLDSATQLPPPKFTSMNSGNSRPKGMQRRISVGLPTHLRLQGKGYGVPAVRKPNFAPSGDLAARAWITPTEVLSSILVALSFVFVSRLHDQIALSLRNPNQTPTDQPLESSVSEPRTPLWIGSLELSALVVSLAVTAGTLLLGGLIGKTQTFFTSQDQPGQSTKMDEKRSVKSSRTIVSNVQKIVGKVSCVALPMYAASSLGGTRVSLVILVAVSSRFITLEDGSAALVGTNGWKQLFKYRRWTLLSILVQVLFDFISSTHMAGNAARATGYLALAISIVALPPPFPSVIRASTGHAEDNSAGSGSVVLSSGFETASAPSVSSLRKSTISPLISSTEELGITFRAGFASATLCMLVWFVSNPSMDALYPSTFGWFSLATSTTVACFLAAQPKSLQENRGVGVITGSITGAIVPHLFNTESSLFLAYQGGLISICFLATQIDTSTFLTSRSKSSQQPHSSNRHTTSHASHGENYSKLTLFLLKTFQHRPVLHSILVEKDSRRIFYFMSLNFAFMLVQLFYGIATGSLGLLSDSIHMFFDCVALVVGLCAAVMSKWPPTPRFPYGYSKIDTMAGFANGIFLMLISLEIVYEAIERLVEGSEMQRIGELLTVSTLGLVVNLVGVTAFGHAHHGHSHDDHSHHDHSHHSHDQQDHFQHDHGHVHGHTANCKPSENHDHLQSASKQSAVHHHHHQHEHEHDPILHPSPNPSPYSSVPATPSKPVYSQSLANEAAPHHHHGHGNENMHGIYLHVLADTLGSVAVVISTLLIHFYGWSGFDPLASCLIAILIFVSAIPLVKSTAKKLLLTIPGDVEFDLREALAGVSALKGVTGYAAPKFWLDEGQERRVIGVIHITAAKGTDMEDLRSRAVAYLRSKNMDVIVQVEREGVSRCWCKGKAV